MFLLFSLSEATHTFYGLERDPALSHHSTVIRERMVKALEPFHYLAYLTDHRYTEESVRFVSIEDEQSAEAWLNERDPTFHHSLLLFHTRDARYFPGFLFNDASKKIHPGVWWQNIQVILIKLILKEIKILTLNYNINFGI